MKLRLVSLILLATMTVPFWAQSFSKTNTVVPIIANQYANDARFMNPAELVLNKQYLSAKLNFSSFNNQTGFQLFAHAIDVWGLGDFAIGTDIYGSDLGDNLVVIEKTVDCNDDPTKKCLDSSLALIRSGTKMHATWAKETRFLSFGLQYRFYNFKDLQNQSNSRYAHSLDGGFFFTPLSETYIGFVMRNIGDSTIRDHNGNEVIENGKNVQFSEEMLLTLGLTSSNKDLALSVALPVEIVSYLKEDSTEVLRHMSFQLTKYFSNTVELSGGYSSRDMYVRLGYQFNRFLRCSITGSKQALQEAEPYVSFSMDLSLPESLFKSDDSEEIKPKVTSGSRRKQYRKGKKGHKKPKKRRAKHRRDRDQDDDDDNMEDDILDDMEDDINDDLDDLRRRKKKLRKYRKKKEIERDLDDIDV